MLRLVCRSVGWSRSAGWSVIGLIISCAAFLFGGLVQLDGCLVGWLCWLVDQSLGRRIIWTIGHLVSCLLVGGMVVWLVVGPVFGQWVDWLLDP